MFWIPKLPVLGKTDHYFGSIFDTHPIAISTENSFWYLSFDMDTYFVTTDETYACFTFLGEVLRFTYPRQNCKNQPLLFSYYYTCFKYEDKTNQKRKLVILEETPNNKLKGPQ